MSVVLKPYHEKDPQNDMYLAADHHLKIFGSRDPHKQNLSFHDFSKIADLQARSAALGAAL